MDKETLYLSRIAELEDELATITSCWHEDVSERDAIIKTLKAQIQQMLQDHRYPDLRAG